MAQTITVIPGDGIGPEVTDATLEVLNAAEADLEYDMQLGGITALEKVKHPLPLPGDRGHIKISCEHACRIPQHVCVPCDSVLLDLQLCAAEAETFVEPASFSVISMSCGPSAARSAGAKGW